jgi:hypothetical protein
LFGCITGVAIEPLHEGIFSDHHTLIVDFDTGKLLGHAIHIAKPKTRLLTSTRKKPIHQYRTALDSKLQVQNVYTRVTKLLAKYSTTKPPTQWMEDQTETLDRYITDCMLSAEATIHRHSLDDFSPKKVKMAAVEKFWKLVLHAHRNRSPTPMQLMVNIMEKFTDTDFSGMDDKLTIIEKLQESKENYKEAIAHGKELHHEFLLERADIACQNGNLSMEAAIKQLAQIEATIQTYASIKRVMH